MDPVSTSRVEGALAAETKADPYSYMEPFTTNSIMRVNATARAILRRTFAATERQPTVCYTPPCTFSGPVASSCLLTKSIMPQRSALLSS